MVDFICTDCGKIQEIPLALSLNGWLYCKGCKGNLRLLSNYNMIEKVYFLFKRVIKTLNLRTIYER